MGQYLNRGFAMSNDAQDSVDSQVQQNIRNYRYQDRQRQPETLCCGGRRYDAAKRREERLSHGVDEFHEAGRLSRSQKVQEESHRQEPVNYIEDVINDLRNPGRTAPA